MFCFFEIVNRHFDFFDYVLSYFNFILLVLLFQVFLYSPIYVILIILYFTLITFALSKKLKNIVNDIRDRYSVNITNDFNGQIRSIDDELRFDHMTETKNQNIDKISNTVNSLFYYVIGRHCHNFTLHDQYKNLIRNMIKHDINTNRFYQLTIHIILQNFYYDLIRDHDITLSDIENQLHRDYIINEYEKTIEKNI